MSSSESKKKQMISRSTQTIITNEDFNRIKPYQSQMSNEDFRNMFYNRKKSTNTNSFIEECKKIQITQSKKLYHSGSDLM